MKTILVPTDFSSTSMNAVNYATGLCQAMGARLVLFHAFMLPVPVSEVPFVMITADEMQRTTEESLRKEAETIFNASGIEVETIARMGMPLDEIKDLEKEKGIDLVVMGTSGSNNLEKLMGSTTNGVIRKFKKPVLVIPENAKFNGLRKICYATDFDFQTNLECFEPLLTILRKFNSELTIVHFHKDGKSLTAEQNASKSRMESIWNDLNHSYQVLESADYEEGIVKYLDGQATDLLVVVAHHHNIIERLFGHHTSSSLSEKTATPLLVLKDKS